MRLQFALSLALLLAAGAAPAAHSATFRLSSPDVKASMQVPEKFVLDAGGCSGGNVSPELEWSGVPTGTQSFVVTVFDEDEHGTPSGWWHWVVYDIPAATSRLTRGAGSMNSDNLPAGALQGRNDDGNPVYEGPCPEVGDPPHRYVFTIYALKTGKLPVKPGAGGALVTFTLHEFTLAKATLIARHRNTAAPAPGPKVQ